MAHASLLRTNTLPIATADSMDRMNGMGMPGAPRASQLSGSSTFPTTNSSSSVNTLSTATTIATTPNGQVMATSNIINQRADASRSLYQICVALKQRLAKVPGFDEYMEQLEYMATDPDEGGPVESLWKLLRTGYPLLAIYNALQPEVPLQVQEVPEMSQAKRSKIAILRFVEACKSKLMLPTTEVFIITDLAGNDTTGFVKVTGAINHVLDLAEQRGLLLQIQPYPEDDIMEPGSQMSYRDYVVRELVDTERKYVQDLENLHDLKKKLEQDGIITGDKIHDIFLNINAILDCQRKFLIRVETTNSMPQARQEWGGPFVAYEETFNMCYQPFIANQRRAGQLASEVFDKIQAAQHPVACDFNTLDGFLLKPMQRLVKYPLLLKDLLKKCEDEATREDLAAGIDSAERVLQKANEAVNKDLLKEAVKELVTRVEDWKKHRVEQFGELLLHGVYTVVTGKGDQEKDYEIYLFQSILLCCKEVVPGKTKDKKDKTRSTGPKIRNRNAKLQLKGRIFMTNVTDVVALSKTGSYTVQIWWKGDPGVENFMIKFTNEDMMKKWAAGLEQQRKENAPRLEQKPDRVDEFAWMKNIGGELKNPYGEDGDDSEDETVTNGSIPGISATTSQPTLASMPGTIQRNASSTSLRSRSFTNGSINSVAGDNRVPPPRFPMVPPATTLNISTLQAQVSPLPRPPESYFSPVAESPASSRASTTSGVFTGANGYPFPKASTPQPWNPDDHNRYTAPAMPRAPSRDGSSPSNAFGPNGRNPRGPSMPVMPRDSTPPSQVRSRSLSTPDISGQPQRSAQQIPAVPGIPPHLHQNHPSHPTHVRHDSSISRSNSGSPANDLPLRTNNNSPGRTRAYAPTMSQFPSQPVYPRQGTPGTGSNLPPPGPPPPGLAPLAPLDSGRSTTPGLSTAPLSSNQGGPPVTPDISMPNQLKVKVNYDYNAGLYFTLVAQFNITYQSLVDRIDVKLARLTNSSIGRGDLKLRYRDEDGDFVSIGNDDDIQIAISEWREAQGGMPGGLGEIELFCVGEI